MDDAERMRLLYVGATRARDHLVVSLHRDSKAKTNTAAKLLTDAGGRTNAVPLEDLPEPPATATGETRTEAAPPPPRSEEHTSELQSRGHLVCRLLLEKKNK